MNKKIFFSLRAYTATRDTRPKPCGMQQLGPEALSCSVFYSALKTVYRRYLEDAYANHWTVCVPQNCSLRGPITRFDIETHILVDDSRASGGVNARAERGHHTTLNGRRVRIHGSHIVTLEGFSPEAPAKVEYIYQLTVTPSDERLNAPSMGGGRTLSRGGALHEEGEGEGPHHSLLYLCRPLHAGGIDAPKGHEDFDRTTVRAFIAFLRAHPEFDSVFAGMERGAVAIEGAVERDLAKRRAWRAAHGTAPAAVADVELRCKGMRKYLQRLCEYSAGALDSMLGHGDLWRGTVFVEQEPIHVAQLAKQQRLKIRQAVESYVLDGVHETLLPWMHFHERERTRMWIVALEEMAHETPESLLISPWYRCDQRCAIDELLRLSTYHTALEKLQCLLKTSNAIRRAMEDHVDALFRGPLCGADGVVEFEVPADEPDSDGEEDAEFVPGAGMGGAGGAGASGAAALGKSSSSSAPTRRVKVKIKRKRRADMECSPDDLIAQILWVMLQAYRRSRTFSGGVLCPPTEAELLRPNGVASLLTNIDFIDTFHLFNLDITALG